MLKIKVWFHFFSMVSCEFGKWENCGEMIFNGHSEFSEWLNHLNINLDEFSSSNGTYCLYLGDSVHFYAKNELAE